MDDSGSGGSASQTNGTGTTGGSASTGGSFATGGASGSDTGGTSGSGTSGSGTGGTSGSGTSGSGTGGTSGSGTVAQIFQHCSYGGWSANLALGEYTSADLVALGAANNDASSLHVAEGYELVLYDGDNFTGSSVTITADTSCLVGLSFNDIVSSLRVQLASGGTGGTSGSGGSAGSGGTGGTSGGECRLMLGDVPACCTPSGQDRTNVDEVLQLLNAYRTSLGLNALAVNKQLEEAIQGHCMHMAQAGFFSHTSPTVGLASPWDRAKYCGTSTNAENIAAGYQTPAAVMQGWKNSPGHDANMRGNHTVVGIGEYDKKWGQIFK